MLNSFKKKIISWLRWSEKYTKTDMVYVVKNSGWLTSAKGFSIVASLISATAFANLIPKETYGTYKFVVSAAAIIGAFSLSGMGEAVKQAAARGFESALQYGAKIKFKWSISIFLVGVITAGYYFWQGNMTLTYGMLMIAVMYPLRTSSDVYSDFLKGKKDFKRVSLYKASLEGFQVAAMVITLYATNHVLPILFVFFATNTLAAVFFYFRTKSSYSQNDKEDQDMFDFGKHMSIIKFLHKIATYIDKVLVWHYLGSVQLAVYSFAELPISKMRTVLSSIEEIAFPKFTSSRISKLQNTLEWKVGLFALFNLGIAVIFFLLAPFIYQLLFPEYLASVFYAQVFVFSLVFYSVRIFEKAIESKANSSWLYKIRITSSILKIIGFMLLLPVYGIWGVLGVIAAVDVIRGVIGYIGFKSLNIN
jgi:O-antigen/teichoic acid export membrane protein